MRHLGKGLYGETYKGQKIEVEDVGSGWWTFYLPTTSNVGPYEPYPSKSGAREAARRLIDRIGVEA